MMKLSLFVVFRECVSFMLSLHKKAGEGSVTVVHRKYSLPKYSSVALLNPPSIDMVTTTSVSWEGRKRRWQQKRQRPRIYMMTNWGVMRESIYMIMPMDIHICLFLSNLLLPDSVCSLQEVLCPNNGRAAGWLLDAYYWTVSGSKRMTDLYYYCDCCSGTIFDQR